MKSVKSNEDGKHLEKWWKMQWE